MPLRIVICPVLAAYEILLRRDDIDDKVKQRAYAFIIAHLGVRPQCLNDVSPHKTLPARLCIEEGQSVVDAYAIRRNELAHNERTAFNDVFTTDDPKVAELIKLVLHDGRFGRELTDELRGMDLSDALEHFLSHAFLMDIDGDEWLRRRPITQ